MLHPPMAKLLYSFDTAGEEAERAAEIQSTNHVVASRPANHLSRPLDRDEALAKRPQSCAITR